MQKHRSTPFPFGVSGGSTTSSSLGMTEALNLITDKLSSLETKMSNVASVDQMSSLKTDLLLEFEKHIKELKKPFEQLEKQNTELKSRVTQPEKKIHSVSYAGVLRRQFIRGSLYTCIYVYMYITGSS